MNREKGMGPRVSISSRIRPLRFGDLADIDVDLTTRAFFDFHDLEGTPGVARDGGAIGRRGHAVRVLNDDADVVDARSKAALRGTQNGAVASRRCDIEVALQINPLPARAPFHDVREVARRDKPASWHAARFIEGPVFGAGRCDGFGSFRCW